MRFVHMLEVSRWKFLKVWNLDESGGFMVRMYDRHWTWKGQDTRKVAVPGGREQATVTLAAMLAPQVTKPLLVQIIFKRRTSRFAIRSS
eukprot:5483481-Amphidinium_carterae.1